MNPQLRLVASVGRLPIFTTPSVLERDRHPGCEREATRTEPPKGGTSYRGRPPLRDRWHVGSLEHKYVGSESLSAAGECSPKSDRIMALVTIFLQP